MDVATLLPRDDGPPPIAELLLAWEQGRPGAQDALFHVLYDDLRALAHRQRQRHVHATLNTTALVHEVYLKLSEGAVVPARDRAHFAALMTRALRCVLVDYARHVGRQKRGGDAQRVDLHAAEWELPGVREEAQEILALHEALDALADFDPAMAEVVEMHFFAGLGYAEIAAIRGISQKTVYRTVAKAKVLLSRVLGG